MKNEDHYEKSTLIALAIALAVVLVVALSITVFTAESDGGGAGGNGAAGPDGGTEGMGHTPGTGSTAGSGDTGTSAPENTGITIQEYEQAVSSGPGPGAESPPLPSGEPATHEGTALMTAMVSGQTFKIEVAVTVKLDGSGGFAFAYAGTGTVPVSLGADVAATADYKVGGSFTGTVNDGAFTGNGPAAVEATVNIPGMAPQSGSTTQQLTITGNFHEAGDGIIEGEFNGGTYTGTFRAIKP